MADQKRKITIDCKEKATVYQEKERIKTLKMENKKIFERLNETKSLVDNRAPKKPTGFHIEVVEKKKPKRIESLNLVNRLRESERIMH